MDALCHRLEAAAAAGTMHCSAEHVHDVMVEALAATNPLPPVRPVGGAR
jgi:hypothetical protein